MLQVTNYDPIAEIAKQLPSEYLVHANEVAHHDEEQTIPERDVSILVLRLLLRHLPHQHCAQREVNLTKQTWTETKRKPRVFCDIAIFWPWVKPDIPVEQRIAAPIEIKLATSPFPEVVVDLMRLTALSEQLNIPSYFMLIGQKQTFDNLLGSQLARLARNSIKGTKVNRKDILALLPIRGGDASEDSIETRKKYARYHSAVSALNQTASFRITRVHNEIFGGVSLGIWEVVPFSMSTPDRGRFSFTISKIEKA